ncbi:lactamase [Candidatus Cerribacteria bacterium 'Amazon FNV 2010 28 9']|uniref:Lactamase n=1 Tax=Candidatus Cerribacteria bacterium 'Amazon FNV 2010 28 9' TaxID=2081795 RepID=A0A317JTL4_9BACT|nr:MAG: lactamase [Candidatus Cerribacteria bacterium 'Amazon FNV 2010 28 9']
MEITYLGHSAFKLKGKQGTVITDPYPTDIGLSMGSVSADIVTISHQHADHNAVKHVSGTARREKPWVADSAGEYEVSGISVFGYQSFHDEKQGEERGRNIIYSIIIDGVNVVHLGDLGHNLSQEMIEKLGNVDVLLCPVGGKFTIDPKVATEVIQAIEPYFVIPMHYKTAKHGSHFAQLATLEDFEKVYGVHADPVKSLNVTSATMPEQTTLVVLEN